MKVDSPVGEYEYRVKRVSLSRGRVEVVGSLGQWETKMVIEPSDWVALGRRAAPVIAAATLLLALRRR